LFRLTIKQEDRSGNSYVQNFYYPIKPGAYELDELMNEIKNQNGGSYLLYGGSNLTFDFLK